MSIHVALHHKTTYRYDRAVGLGPQVVRLRPAPHARSRVLSYSLHILPNPHFINWQQDPQSNYMARLVFPEQTDHFTVTVDLVVEMSVFNPFDFFLEPQAETVPFAYDRTLDHELEPFRHRCPLTPLLAERLEGIRHSCLATPAGKPGPRTVDFLVSVNRTLWQDIRYIIRLEPGVQSPEETLEKRRGSCRDSAWLLCQLLRHCGLATRFVSGYLIQLTPDVPSLDGPSGPASDFTDLHAWCEVYLPGAGWIGLDPTSGLLAGEGHIPLACAPEPSSAAPISGPVDVCESTMDVQMKVRRIHESPRVTKPYTDEQWARIQELGTQVDHDLDRMDVRLTVGGEPTFVSIDDVDGPEWNTLALGTRKRELAGNLIRRLRGRFAPGGLLFYGQGKWYPGESLPRWALSCIWRRDGLPIWNDPALIADESIPGTHSHHEARLLATLIARHLGVDSRFLMPAHEDAWYYAWKERRLPCNVDPLASNLTDPEDRARLAHVFRQGLGTVVGYVLPLRKSDSGDAAPWISGSWFLRDETLWLIPGDSPIGFRLPLDSLPWIAEPDREGPFPVDPNGTFPRLPVPHQRAIPAGGATASHRLDHPRPRGQSLDPAGPSSGHPPEPGTGRRPGAQESAPWIVRTALCVEPRHGRLHIFLPPVPTAADFLDLIGRLEEAVTEFGHPVILEGTPPPWDPGLEHVKVTPDPGVLEVNIHPARSWPDLVDRTSILYDEARLARLSTEKFMLDGRHTGTGGGNHIVLGGPTPHDSPFLRRPDLLRSLLTHWQNHPSLSFLFSSLFIGPTSQSPRIDEARHDSLHELETAFRQIPDHGPCQPWLVDRLLRNLLIDSTGNTHRAEFCIDKLYPPETASARLGLLEMRAFEMPPHARMSLAQQLLLRTLVARFWRTPARTPLVRWGTDIHDRWMLPWFVWNDFKDVLADLRSEGYPLDPEWYRPHFEFRFPWIGDLALDAIHIELRQALEPWHVLGEQDGPGGTVRYVDSSLERIQVLARGLTPGRHQVCVGRRPLPLHPTGTNSEAVAGVRYRAWQPANCLHPTIGVHTPLVIDVYDTWNRRSLGGCTYHVMHPGGRDYQTFPVNAYEAESRRLARFFRSGHTPGAFDPCPAVSEPTHPFTLDLRRT